MGGWAARGRLIAVFGAAAIAVGALTLGITGADEAEGPLTVEVLDASVSDGQLTSAINITNSDGLRHELDVYLTLGVFGADDAWDRRVAESSSQEVAVRSGEAVVAVWDEPVAVPIGDYELTAWVRLSSTDGQVLHETATESVRVSQDGLARVDALNGGPHLAELDLDASGGEYLSVAGAAVADDVTDDATVKVDVLAPTPAEPWWSRQARFSFVAPVEVDAGGDHLAPIDEVLALPPGDYVIRVELLVDDELQDQVLLPGGVTIDDPDPDLLRAELPVGPIAISAVTTDSSWGADDAALVVVEVQNLSTEPVDGLFWWILAAPGEPEPWRFAEAGSFEVQRRLEPREQRTVRLALDGDLNVGRGFEISIWAHTVDEDGSSTHSDGIRIRDLIDTIDIDSDNLNGEAQ